MQVPTRLVLVCLALIALAAAMRQVLGGNRRYEQCLQEADADLAKAQACVDLVGQ
jgi:hypothetical protein